MKTDEIHGLIDDLTAPFGSVLTRLWLVGPGDICASCLMLAECPDQRRCLHLTLSLGTSARLDGPFRRFPIGARQVGRVASERTPFVARDHLPSLGLADPSWLAGHAVQSFAAFPLAVAEELLGVLALFSHWRLDPRDVRSLAASARLLAEALAERTEPSHASTPLRSLAAIQREAIERVLAHTGGRVSGPRGAAAILGLKSTTLHSRMRKLGVKRRPRD
ncbi:MAG TPA: GAF domain-containing protein [Candidatus Eisenbacteria bacterium]